MKYRLQIPGKTFCCGEYAALAGGAAILVTTNPGFEMNFQLSENGCANPFHSQSPAGFYFQHNRAFFSRWAVEFKDHYQGRGGFGASTAQFIGLSYFQKYVESSGAVEKDPSSLKILWRDIWDNYRGVNKCISPLLTESQLPSGYDLWSQMVGRISVVKRTMSAGQIDFWTQKTEWPFDELDFLIVPTGFKVATHVHLEQLNTEYLHSLAGDSEHLVNYWLMKKAPDFLKGLERWVEKLDKLDLIHANTKDLVTELRRHSEIVFAKGCGALGADILFVIFKREMLNAVRIILSEMGLKTAYGRSDVWGQEVKVQTW